MLSKLDIEPILIDMEETAKWYKGYNKLNGINGLFRISPEDLLCWVRQIREVIDTKSYPTNRRCGRCCKNIKPEENYEGCGSTGNPDNPSEMLWYHNTKQCHGAWREEEYVKVNTRIECDDCGVKTDDLITKSDHHGGMKTVCADRILCHARGG